MSQHTIDELLDYINRQKREIKDLIQQLNKAQSLITELKESK